MEEPVVNRHERMVRETIFKMCNDDEQFAIGFKDKNINKNKLSIKVAKHEKATLIDNWQRINHKLNGLQKFKDRHVWNLLRGQ